MKVKKVIEDGLEDIGVDDGLVDNFSVEPNKESEYFQIDTTSLPTNISINTEKTIEGIQVQGHLFQ